MTLPYEVVTSDSVVPLGLYAKIIEASLSAVVITKGTSSLIASLN